ncbi:MAG: 2-succinyl-5-enolpyruvyl-6-hydroxy-3-cyclohexene-1-carboxylic-acid synthase [Verrucomicrobia bacterium]|nr:2-succinyl-5-enolpyruvyl-6-hydroxy-3-cyclohexene-1-carboxylic-acid synthase [Verrucomicrobiota bacterium]
MARSKKFVNTNALWSAVGVRTLANLGLRHVVISPGSRSTPLAFAFAENPEIGTTVALDERSAGFIALGLAKATREPVALLCTSGTAGANYLPAVIEARLSATPLLVLTADRPPELRDCHSGQTITQNGLFGGYPVWATEAAVPSADLSLLRYWRQLLVDCWQRAQGPLAGPVHLNLPFRDPLPPSEPEKGYKAPAGLDLEAFTTLPVCAQVDSLLTPASVADLLPKTERGVIVVGPHAPADRQEFADALLELSHLTGWPILVDGAGTLRGDLAGSGRLVSAYDLILRDPKLAQALRPTAAIFVGPLPTSKVLRAWLKDSDVGALQINRAGENVDPTHGRWTRLDGTLTPSGERAKATDNARLSAWSKAQKNARAKLERIARVDWNFEGRIVTLLEEALGPDDRLFIGSSMPIRDLEWFYHPPGPGPEVLCNRGANGIDGTVSTALGASLDGKRTVLLCGDLTFLHDSNALLSAYGHTGDLTVVVVNNQGGGIFNHLAVAKETKRFEQLWGTPQAADLGKLCAAHGVRHDLAETWTALARQLERRGKGVRVIEFRTDREADAAWRLKSFR